MSSFKELGVCEQLLRALEQMKYETPTPIQTKAIPILLSGRDVIASSQTGTGKTSAFGVPLVQKLIENPNSQAVVLAPTRELAVQIVNVLKDLTMFLTDFNGALLIGGDSMWNQKKALQRSPRMIVATPGRLVDHLRTNQSLLSNVDYLVLDEADRMLDLGFAPQLDLIRKAIPSTRQTLLFSATFPSDISKLATVWLSNPERIISGSSTQAVAQIKQSVLKVQDDMKKDTLLQELQTRTGGVLVFARTKRRTDSLAVYLENQGLSVCRIHGDRSQAQRRAAIEGFRKERYRIMVATDIAARGIDVPCIEHVINYDLPMVAEDYLHRIGRTGRAGRKGESLCMVTPHERSLWRNIERLMASKEGLPSDQNGHSFKGRTTSSRSNGNERNSNKRDNFGKRSFRPRRSERSSDRYQSYR